MIAVSRLSSSSHPTIKFYAWFLKVDIDDYCCPPMTFMIAYDLLRVNKCYFYCFKQKSFVFFLTKSG